VRHIEALGAQTGPAFWFTARGPRSTRSWPQTAPPPETDFTAADGVRHSGWVLDDPADIAFVQPNSRLSRPLHRRRHHRSAAAGRVYQARRAAPGGAGPPMPS